MRHVVTDVPWSLSLCVCVCVLDITTSCAETAELLTFAVTESLRRLSCPTAAKNLQFYSQ